MSRFGPFCQTGLRHSQLDEPTYYQKIGLVLTIVYARVGQCTPKGAEREQSVAALRDRKQSADCVEKVGFSSSSQVLHCAGQREFVSRATHAT